MISMNSTSGPGAFYMLGSAYRTFAKRNEDTVLSYEPLYLSAELRKSTGIIFYAAGLYG